VDSNSHKVKNSCPLLPLPQELLVELAQLRLLRLKIRKKKLRRMLIWEDFSVMMMVTDEVLLLY
jgi:hypothetical protein